MNDQHLVHDLVLTAFASFAQKDEYDKKVVDWVQNTDQGFTFEDELPKSGDQCR
jgi:hypothetical protein